MDGGGRGSSGHCPTTWCLKMSSSSSSSSNRSSSSSSSSLTNNPKRHKGKLLVLGGTGFLGQTICKRASLEGYQVTSLSRRGLPSPDITTTILGGSDESTSSSTTSASGGGSITSTNIDYRIGDARNIESIQNILNEGGYVGVIHCIGLLLDDESGLGNLNRFISGSGSIPDSKSTYDTITRLSAFNAIDATLEYLQYNNNNNNNNYVNNGNNAEAASKPKKFPFVFLSAAEAGWPNVPGGSILENYLAPNWLKRYLLAKRAVESKLLDTTTTSTNKSSRLLRPIIMRPSLIYSLDRPASYIPVGAFFVGNKMGLPFVDRPVTVQSLANAIVRSISRDSVQGILRYSDIDKLNE